MRPRIRCSLRARYPIDAPRDMVPISATVRSAYGFPLNDDFQNPPVQFLPDFWAGRIRCRLVVQCCETATIEHPLCHFEADFFNQSFNTLHDHDIMTWKSRSCFPRSYSNRGAYSSQASDRSRSPTLLAVLSSLPDQIGAATANPDSNSSNPAFR